MDLPEPSPPTELADQAFLPAGGRGGGSSALVIAMSLMLLALVLSRLSGMVRDVIVAQLFGTTSTTDSFYAAYSPAELVSSLLLAGLVGVALIPVFMRSYLQRDSTSWSLISAVLNWLLLCSAAGVVLGVIESRSLIRLLTPGLREDDLNRAAELSRVMLPGLLFFAVSSVFTGVLNAGNRFLIPTLAGFVVNLAMIVVALVLSGSLGIAALAWGFLVGSALQLAIQVPAVLSAGFRYRLTLGLADPRLRAVFLAMAPLILLTVFGYGRLLVERWIGSGLPEGTIAVLNFANRLLLVAPALVVAPVSTVLYPSLARSFIGSEKMNASGADLVAIGLRLILLAILPTAVLLRLFGHPLVAALYQRGAFDAASANATAYLLGLFALALVPIGLNEFLTRTYFARRRPAFALTAAFAGFATTMIGDLALTARIGVPGLAYGAALGSWTTFVIFAVEQRLWKQLNFLRPALKTAIAATVMLAAAYLTAAASRPLHSIPGELALALGAAGLAYVTALLFLRSEDLGLVGRLSLRHLPLSWR